MRWIHFFLNDRMKLYCIVLYCIVLYCIVLYVRTVVALCLILLFTSLWAMGPPEGHTTLIHSNFSYFVSAKFIQEALLQSACSYFWKEYKIKKCKKIGHYRRVFLNAMSERKHCIINYSLPVCLPTFSYTVAILCQLNFLVHFIYL